jgi:hypothetical protein
MHNGGGWKSQSSHYLLQNCLELSGSGGPVYLDKYIVLARNSPRLSEPPKWVCSIWPAVCMSHKVTCACGGPVGGLLDCWFLGFWRFPVSMTNLWRTSAILRGWYYSGN